MNIENLYHEHITNKHKDLVGNIVKSSGNRVLSGVANYTKLIAQQNIPYRHTIFRRMLTTYNGEAAVDGCVQVKNVVKQMLDDLGYEGFTADYNVSLFLKVCTVDIIADPDYDADARWH